VVVGHNPTVEQVLAGLVGEGRGMRPGAVAVVDLDAGRLVEFWEPAR
jgi:phosphohistidine phosphatase SixA